MAGLDEDVQVAPVNDTMTAENQTPKPKNPFSPLGFWRVILIFFLAEVVCVPPVLILREGFGVMVPMWVAFGLAGGLGALATGYVAGKKRAELDAKANNSD